MQKCICGKQHKSRGKINDCVGKIIKGCSVIRNVYAAIIRWDGKSDHTPKLQSVAVINSFKDCLDKEYVDFDRKGRGSALNHDLYGYDPIQGVAVIQSRNAFRARENDFMNTHKTYFLCGYNENTNKPFRHPISAAAVRGAIRSGADSVGVVKAAQCWMWGVTEKQLEASVRQGDLLLVPERGEPHGDYMGQIMTLARSHEVHASAIRKNGRIYARNPQLIHVKGQHAPVEIHGWASVRVARDVTAWDFAARIGD